MPSAIITGDCLDVMRQAPDAFVQTVVTSPPYFGLRDYGTGQWEGGDATCDHLPETARRGIERRRSTLDGGVAHITAQEAGAYAAGTCARCGARRTDQQLGLEATPDAYVAGLVEIFREVRRALRDDGTVWLNLGDSYAGAGTIGRNDTDAASLARRAASYGTGQKAGSFVGAHGTRPGVRDRKSKDLLGIPWMVAFALRDDGWYLRSDIIWAKPNPMPESVRDRPTKAHEYVFLLSKSPRYFYDADAIREEHSREWWNETVGPKYMTAQDGRNDGGKREGDGNPAGRNKRSVWTVATQPYPGAHFATFPPRLVEPMILAGTSPYACGRCGAPWARVTERTPAIVRPSARRTLMRESQGERARTNLAGTMTQAPSSVTTGWTPTCNHDDDTGRCIVLDPFAGAGTTGVVAGQLERDFIGVELNADYADMARARIALEGRPGNHRHEPPVVVPGQLEFPT